MRYHVVIFEGDNHVISDDIWYGSSLDNVKFWVDLAIKDIVYKTSYGHLHYKLREV